MTKYKIHTDGHNIYIHAPFRLDIRLTPEDFLDLQQAMHDFGIKVLRTGLKAGEKK